MTKYPLALWILCTTLPTAVFTTPAAARPGVAAELGQLNPAQPCQARKSNPVTYNVDFDVVVTAPYHTKLLKVWMPLPQTDAGQEVEEKGLNTFPLKVEPRVATEKVFGNTFAS